MERTVRKILLAGLAASFLWTIPASAQRRHDRDVANAPTANQIVDMADARIAALKADLHLTSDQEKNWGGFQAALHDIAVQRADEFAKRSAAASPNGEAAANSDTQPSKPSPTANADNSEQNQPAGSNADNASAQNQSNAPPQEIQSLRDQADVLDRRAGELKKIADAAQPLYVSLDDTQRSQLMNFIRSNGGQDQATPQQQQRRRRRR